MSGRHVPSVRDFFALIDRRKTALLAVLSAASAVAEGIGLLLLVPMLAVLGNSSGPSGMLGSVFERIGLPRSLPLLLGLFVGLVIVRGVLNLFRLVTAQAVETGLVDRLRNRAWRALLHCEWRMLANMRQSDNASLLITSLERVAGGAHFLVSGAISAITLCGIALAALLLSPLTSAVAIVGGGLVVLAYRRLRHRAAMLGEALNTASARVYAEVAEGLAALRVIKSFGIEEGFETRLRDNFIVQRRAERAYVRDVGVAQLLLQGCGALLLAIVVWGAIEVWHAPVATVLPMVALFARALPLLGQTQEAWQNWAHARPALDETLQLLAVTEAAREPDLPVGTAVPQARQSIKVERATVAHPGRTQPALDNVDLELRFGTITAIVGPSGAGKSTLADILGGLIAPDSGALVIDGVTLDNAMRRAWRQQVTYVQQEPLLFTGTIRENLALAAPGANDDTLLEALRRASAGFVEHLPDGLGTTVGEGGRQLSGGERQRIALARALLRRPRLLILDEAASALDSENEAAIAGAILRMREEMTIFIIGHRGALTDIADRTVRIEAGRIEGGRVQE